MAETTRTEADSIIETVTKLLECDEITVALPNGTTASAVAVAKGFELLSLKEFADEYRDAPERREGTAQLGDLASFIAHANRFRDADSAVFADVNPSAPALTSVLDYHRAGGEGAPRFGKHRGVYRFPLSDEWKAWKSKDGIAMSQGDFAEWMENRIQDVADPSTALEVAQLFAAQLQCTYASGPRLLELSRGLSIRVEQKVTNAQVLSSGEVSLQFATSHTDDQGAPIKVPSAALLVLPVFRGGAVYQVPVRLRYRAREGRITWSFDLQGADRVITHAIKEACDLVVKETTLPIYTGAPEA